jgi:hypothetical protein
MLKPERVMAPRARRSVRRRAPTHLPSPVATIGAHLDAFPSVKPQGSGGSRLRRPAAAIDQRSGARRPRRREQARSSAGRRQDRARTQCPTDRSRPPVYPARRPRLAYPCISITGNDASSSRCSAARLRGRSRRARSKLGRSTELAFSPPDGGGGHDVSEWTLQGRTR